VSAKGGDLLTRTVDNFFPPPSREAGRLRNGDGDEDSEEEESDGDVKRTPKDDKMEVDEPGSVGRSTRCMLHTEPTAKVFLTTNLSTPPCASTACTLPA
jgi:chromatin structure-remodeling complex subunit RSC9